ncbi:MAG: type II toxin-antitoxin system RelE/ParE family toxin [Alphaproteobacteria bacterium]|nr:type II toxin-antitoxin system RelE/ParE family toxin [Alphaproteobacteria bacterium]
MRIFKNRWFIKFAHKEGIADKKLIEAVKDAEAGKIDVDYGGGVIKQRISRKNEGKSGGYRSIILFRQGKKAFFVYGFAKNDQNNINKSEEREFKILAQKTLAISDGNLEIAIKAGIYQEVQNDD